ncbi:MAG: LLM class flavin-dependent oxidoreductase [Novosphingobium sp.]
MLDPVSAAESVGFAQRVEQLGYSALWQPEGFGRNVLVQSGWLLANTSTLIVATGIVNIYARDPIAVIGAQYGLPEQPQAGSCSAWASATRRWSAACADTPTASR